MMISEDYALSYNPNENTITILLPQTLKTATNTVSPIVSRRTDIEETDLMCLLTMTRIIFKNATPITGGKADG